MSDMSAMPGDALVDWHAIGRVDTLFHTEAGSTESTPAVAPSDEGRSCPARACLSLNVAGVQVALFKVAGEVYAIDDRCTHGNAYLSEGELDGFEIECPMHAGVFDVRTGAVLGPPAIRPARCHGVKIEDGRVFIRITPRT